jgi:hypothetical protein
VPGLPDQRKQPSPGSIYQYIVDGKRAVRARARPLLEYRIAHSLDLGDALENECQITKHLERARK